MSESQEIGAHRDHAAGSGRSHLEPLVVVADGPPVLSPGAAVVLARIVRAYLAQRRATLATRVEPALEVAGQMEGTSVP